MRRASTLFSEEQQQRIAQTVGQAESRTSAEIVPVMLVLTVIGLVALGFYLRGIRVTAR
jgi:uncharacterized membrane protein